MSMEIGIFFVPVLRRDMNLDQKNKILLLNEILKNYSAIFSARLSTSFTTKMSPTLAWISLITAGIFEVVWAYFFKQSDGLTKTLPTILFVITLAISMILLALSVKVIPIGIAYPIWTGVGAVGSVIIGIIFFGEALTLLGSIFLMMIIGGVIGLKFFS